MAACLYCGARAQSREHIFASWIIELLSHDARVLTLPVDLTISDGDGKVLDQRVGGISPKPSLNLTRRVCSACNNGWMNLIDERARAALTEMINGQRIQLDHQMQAAVAAWAIKTALTSRAALPTPDFIDPNWTTDLRNTEAPLPGWFVWVGKYDGLEPFFYFGEDISVLAPPQANISGGAMLAAHGVTMTVVLGYLLVQVFHVEGGTPATMNLPLVQIWPDPAAEVTWPPPHHFADDLLRGLAARFRGGVTEFSVPRQYASADLPWSTK